jgi:putative ABC transport system permease protein
LTPGFTVVALLVLSLGIGITASMFSVVNGVLLRPLPYPNPERLVWIGMSWPSLHEELMPGADYVEWREGNHSLQDIAAFGMSGTQGYDFQAKGEPQRIAAARVTGNFFDVTGVHPDVGRGFAADEDRPGGPFAVVLSYPFWLHEFGGQKSAIGSKVVLNDQPYTVVGVMPKSFRFPGDLDFDALVSLQLNAAAQADRRQMAIFHTIARLKPGVSLDQARADVGRLLADAQRRFPFFYRSDNQVVLVPLQEHEIRNVRLLLYVLLGAVGLVLLIACANVANLLLTRAAGRQREVAVRMALGASRARIIRQFIVESSILSCAGGLAGIGLAVLVTRALQVFGGTEIPRAASVRIDWRVLVFALAISLLTGILMGLAPALAAWSSRWHMLLKEGGTTSTRSTGIARRFLVTAEIALSLALVLGAGLLVKSLWRLQHVPLGFQPQRVLAAQVSLSGHQYQDKNSQLQFWNRSIDSLGVLPGAESVAISTGIPPNKTPMILMVFSRSDAPPPQPGHRGDNVLLHPVNGEYFRTMGIPLIRGRLIADGDTQDSQLVGVVNQAFVRKYFPNEEVIGKGVMAHISKRWKTVVGVVGDVKNDGIANDIQPEVYLPYTQADSFQIQSMNLLVRTAIKPEYLMPEMRKAIAAIDPERPVVFKTLEENLDTFRSRPRFNAIVFAAFALLALLLAMFGVYGVLSYATAQRTREIGVRMALGASPARILWWSIYGMAPLTLCGIILGLGGGWILSRYLASLLFEVSPHDIVTFASVSAVLTVTAFAASLLPARRAALVDPAISLRSE